MHIDALHADAGLARIAESRVRRAQRRVVEIGPVAVHHQRRIAAQLQQHALAPGTGLQLPAHLCRAGEADELDAIFLLREPGRVRVRKRQHGDGFLGPSGFENHLAERQCGEWRLRRRLQNQRAAGGQRRRGLVRYQVQRKIERSNGENRPDRKALHQPPAALIPFSQVERNGFPAQPRSLFGSGLEGKHGAVHFRARKAHGLAGLGHNELRKALLLLDEGRGHVFQNFAALPARQRASAAQAGDGVMHGLPRVGARRHRHAAHQALVPRGANLDGVTLQPFLAAQQKSGLRAGAHLHRVSLLSQWLRFSWYKAGQCAAARCTRDTLVTYDF